MAGACLTLLFALALTLSVRALLDRWLGELDPAEAFGVAGLIGLGTAGLLTLFQGVVPGGLTFPILPLVPLIGLAKLKRLKFELASPTGFSQLGLLACFACALLALVGVLAPATSLEWDSLAYHLAVPKLWLAVGQIEYVPHIHHSNFPFIVDNLYIWGQLWGGEAGAKTFSLAFLILGMLSLFGLARRWYGGTVGWIAAVAFAGAPVVLWESGTAYIDVAHGLFAGLGILYAADLWRSRREAADGPGSALWLSAIMLGFAAGSKYTGLQIIVAVGLVLLIAGLARRQSGVVKSAFVLGLTALAIASPWLIKNVVLVQNPVYPFFSERLGGRDWDAWRAATYRNEQQTFGVGRTESGRSLAALGHAILGLSYQPGRYVNPGQTEGMGFPTGAIGAVPLLAFLAWLALGRLGPREAVTLGSVGIALLMWFFLSQQSRYLTSIVVPGAVLAAGAVTRLRWGSILAVVAGLQLAYSAFYIYSTQSSDQLAVVAGRVDSAKYVGQRAPFSAIAADINKNRDVKKIALYDEVFGYFLDKPYIWANPGHGTVIPYESIDTGPELAAELTKLGITDVYVNLQFLPPADRDRFFAASGLTGGDPYSAEEKAAMVKDLNLKWRWLLADAIRNQAIVGGKNYGQGVLLALTRSER